MKKLFASLVAAAVAIRLIAHAVSEARMHPTEKQDAPL